MPSIPECHPEKQYGARGKCRVCYNKWLRETSLEYRQRCTEASSRARKKPAGLRALKNNTLRHRYGITLVEKENIAQRQENRCAICDEAKELVVEHCHKSGRVRGLTCNRCNQFIAQIERHPGLIEKALAYLRPERAVCRECTAENPYNCTQAPCNCSCHAFYEGPR
jgi:hypothetical protein